MGGHCPTLGQSLGQPPLHSPLTSLFFPNSKCSRGALYTGFSVLVALLLAGQATTAYFLYQQQGRLDKLTVTSQNLQLESLRMKLPKRACLPSNLPSPTHHPSLLRPHPAPSRTHCLLPLA